MTFSPPLPQFHRPDSGAAFPRISLSNFLSPSWVTILTMHVRLLELSIADFRGEWDCAPKLINSFEYNHVSISNLSEALAFLLRSTEYLRMLDLAGQLTIWNALLSALLTSKRSLSSSLFDSRGSRSTQLWTIERRRCFVTVY
jgi:hypothetical protein